MNGLISKKYNVPKHMNGTWFTELAIGSMNWQYVNVILVVE